jgi:hypothetical protein
MKIESNKKVEEILSSLDGCQRVSAPDFYYTRLRARMEGRSGKSYNWILRPIYVVAALLLLLIVNTIVLLKGQNETSTTASDNLEVIQQSIAAEYSLNDNNSMYDLNQDK